MIVNITTNLKNTLYEDKEIQDIMKEFYQIKRDLIIQQNCILSRQVVYKKTYDISRKGSHPIRHQKINITNHKVYLFFITSIQIFEYYYLFLFNYLYIIVYSYSSNY